MTELPAIALPPTVTLLEYAAGDRVEIKHRNTWYPGKVIAAYVHGKNEIIPTYTVELDGCVGGVDITEHWLIRRSQREGDTP